MASVGRIKPNILITGTPGTGKTLTATEVAQRSGLRHVDIGDIAKKGDLYDGWDDQYQCYILDEDKVSNNVVPVLNYAHLLGF